MKGLPNPAATARPRALATWTVALGLVISGRPAWSAAGVGCLAERAGQRALVQVAVTQLFDRDLLRLVELGLVGRLHLDLGLYRRRRFWFDLRVAESSQLYTIAWSKEEGRFTIEGRPLDNPADFGVPTLSLRPEEDQLGGEPAYVEAVARLEVITPASLGQVARWLVTGPQGEAGARTPEPRTLLNVLAADLARTARGRCSVVP